eukprot:Seg3620.2 transcript_id=Seg3620.2/GoldUCD/mRNA.D3Y31 product="Cell division cycle protein 20" protein_id=Seg3620.2/GoldUCD/D3Y31
MFSSDSFNNVNLRFEASIETGHTPRWKRKSKAESCDGGSTMKQNRITTTTPSSICRPMTPRKTPGSSSKTPSKSRTPSKYSTNGDRFIPNRNRIDFDNAHFKLVNEGPKDNNNSPSKDEEERIFKENLNPGCSASKILSFTVKAPASEGHNKNARILYSQNASGGNVKKCREHYIAQVPERILDAPDFINDYYLNLLDWSGGSQLAVALSNNVYLWDSGTGNIVHLCQLDSAGSYVSSLKWEKGNCYLAIGTSDSNVQLWDIEKSKKLRTLPGHASRVGSLSWNSHILSSGCRSGAIHHHDVRIPQHQIGVLSSHSQEVCGLEWSPDGKYLASGGNDNLVNIWDSSFQNSTSPLHSLTQHTAGVKAIAWCPWQVSTLATGGGSADRCIRFWNVNTGNCLNSVDTKSQVCGIVWSKRYKELVSGHGYSQNQLTVWKYPSMKRVVDLTGHSSRVLQLTMSPDETFVMSAAADETLRLWKIFPQEEKTKVKSLSQKDSLSIFKFR